MNAGFNLKGCQEKEQKHVQIQPSFQIRLFFSILCGPRIRTPWNIPLGRRSLYNWHAEKEEEKKKKKEEGEEEEEEGQEED